MGSNVPGVVTISNGIRVGNFRIVGVSRGDFWSFLRLHHTFVVHCGGWQRSYRLSRQIVVVVQIRVILELEIFLWLCRGVRRLRKR